MHTRSKTPGLCPRDNLSLPSKSKHSTHHDFTQSKTSNTLLSILPRKGASISQLHSGSMAASSPSLLGHYWSRTASGKQTHNSGCVDWNGNGTWTRAERGNWCFTGDPESKGPGFGWTDRLVDERARLGKQRGTSTTFGILGHQEDSHLDRLEKRHRAQPGPADNNVDRPVEVIQASILNTKLRRLKTLHMIHKKKLEGGSLKAWENDYCHSYGANKKSKKYIALKTEVQHLSKQTSSMRTLRTTNKKYLARIKSESTTARFVLMEELLRAKRAEPGPSDYQDHVTKRDFGVDGFTQKISNVPRNCPGYNYKQIKMTKDGAAVLLQKDNSYLDVGPGQYEPTRGPAIHASRHAPPQIPHLNPRSRASGAKIFTNSQLLPSASSKLNSIKTMKNKLLGVQEGDSIWWKTGPGLTVRKRPYGNYKGGDQKFMNDQRYVLKSVFLFCFFF